MWHIFERDVWDLQKYKILFGQNITNRSKDATQLQDNYCLNISIFPNY